MRHVMRFLLVVALPVQTMAQEQWEQLTGAAQAYAVDVHSVSSEAGILSARIRTYDRGSRIVVQQVQVRCASSQLRTLERRVYDAETGRPLPRTMEERKGDTSPWPEYEPGSEGHALLSGLCGLARQREAS